MKFVIFIFDKHILKADEMFGALTFDGYNFLGENDKPFEIQVHGIDCVCKWSTLYFCAFTLLLERIGSVIHVKAVRRSVRGCYCLLNILINSFILFISLFVRSFVCLLLCHYIRIFFSWTCTQFILALVLQPVSISLYTKSSSIPILKISLISAFFSIS